jgi:hypothetical protein
MYPHSIQTNRRTGRSLVLTFYGIPLEPGRSRVITAFFTSAKVSLWVFDEVFWGLFDEGCVGLVGCNLWCPSGAGAQQSDCSFFHQRKGKLILPISLGFRRAG